MTPYLTLQPRPAAPATPRLTLQPTTAIIREVGLRNGLPKTLQKFVEKEAVGFVGKA